MRTRVVRYWHQTDWQYKVEHLSVTTVADTFEMIPWIGVVSVYPKPKIGSEVWRRVGGSMDEASAKRIAQELAKVDTIDQLDVVAEFGQ